MPLDPALAPDRRRSALLLICLIEILERYGNFLIAALLPLFLNEQQHLLPRVALRLVGYYLALGYAGGVLGGWLADRSLGYRGATRVGAALLVLGAALLSSPYPGALYPALALLVLGSGFFKPALSAWLGSLYAAEDPVRSAGFAWLYFTANIGTALAPFVGGALRTRYSWPVAFSTTAAAFTLCLIVILVGQTAAAAAPAADRSRSESPTAPRAASAGAPRGRTLSALLVAVVLFSVAFGQSGGALLFFARDHVDRSILGRVVPPDFFASIPSALVLILTVLQQGLLRSLRRRNRALACSSTLLIGMVASGGAFGLLAAVAAAHMDLRSPPQLIHTLWIVGALTLLTMGEILVIPVAMARVSQCTPAGQGALWQGLLSAAMAVGLALAGEAGRFLTEWGAPRFFAAAAAMPLAGALVLYVEARREVRPGRQ